MRHEFIILADSPGALVEVCGISLLERLLRTLQRRRRKRLSSPPRRIFSRHTLRNRRGIAPRLRSTCALAPKVPPPCRKLGNFANDAKQFVVVRGDCLFDSRSSNCWTNRTRRQPWLIQRRHRAAISCFCRYLLEAAVFVARRFSLTTGCNLRVASSIRPCARD